MRSLALFLLLIVVAPRGLVAQDQDRFEIITVENVDRLIEIRNWTNVNGSFLFATFSPDGSELAIAQNNGQVEIISMQTLQTHQIIDDIQTDVQWLTYSSDGSELLLSNHTGIYTLVNTDTREILATNAVANEKHEFSPTFDVRKYALWNYLETGVSIHDTLTGDELLFVEDADIWQVSYDGKLLLTRNLDYVVEIRDIGSGETVFRIPTPSVSMIRDALSGAGFTPEGLVWSPYPQYIDADDGGFWSNPIQFWDISTGEIAFELGDSYAQYLTVRWLIFDPTNSHVLAYVFVEPGADRCLIWNLASHDELLCPIGGNHSAVFSADGQMIATYSGTGLGVAIREVEFPDRPITVLDADGPWYAEFGSDGKFLVTIDRHIRLWGVPSSTG